MAIVLSRQDFYPFGQVAKHCNLEKLQIAINESILFDLKPLLCDLFHFIDEEWEDPNELAEALISPLTYEGCNGKTRSHQGIKTVLTYYAYARYVLINNFDDTPNGGVNKTNEWSIPKPYADLKNVSERYRNMGLDLWREVEAYICTERESYPDGNFKNCKSCGCNGHQCGGTKNKGFGFKSSNITKSIGGYSYDTTSERIKRFDQTFDNTFN